MNGRPEVTYVVMRKPTDADYAQARVPKRLVGIFGFFEPGRRLTCRKVCSEHRPCLPENDSTAASVVSRGLAAVARTGALDRVEDLLNRSHLSVSFVTSQGPAPLTGWRTGTYPPSSWA